MILPDSSAWIEMQRETWSPVDIRLTAAIENGEQLATVGLVMLEVLAGARDERQARELRRLLNRCTFLRMEEPLDYEAASNLYRACRRGGKTIRKLPDCLIASVAIRSEAELLHQDGDFDAIALHAPLHVVDPLAVPTASVGARLLLATRNEHKRREFARLLPGFAVDTLPEEVTLPPEDGDTFEANALGKARAAAAATGRVVIADDSGIEAAALGGAPGVRSARYAGEHATDEQNLAKLLAEAPAGSSLAYVCALAYIDPAGGVERVFEGRCTGRLAEHPRGERGFGYDPAFLPDEEDGGVTMAELSDERKDAISHRGRAVRALGAWLVAN
ncbi:MAG: non-canonical purine NTP pyrophosphatase [Solirubrobacteraceae bacterium]